MSSPSDVNNHGSALSRIKEGKHDDKDLSCLIDYFYSAGDLTPLRELLTSDNSGLVSNGVYILSEIGRSGAPLIDAAIGLARHERDDVRYWAIDSLMANLPRERMISLINEWDLANDEFKGVRRSVARYLERT